MWVVSMYFVLLHLKKTMAFVGKYNKMGSSSNLDLKSNSGFIAHACGLVGIVAKQ
jgi:hypothetical protein